MNKKYITIKNVHKSFLSGGRKRIAVLRDIDLDVYRGEFLVLLGPSGCGKSTLLRMMAQLDKVNDGEITYSSTFLPEKMNFVFQNFGLLPWLSVYENIELGLVGREIEPGIRKKKCNEMLEHFGLTAFSNHKPSELSGGMRQRVGLARAFVTDPEILFLDEPFSELDFFTARALRELLLSLWEKLGTTIVMVSHYIDEAVSLSSRIAVFSERPSTIIGIFENTMDRPRNHRSQEFFEMEDLVLRALGTGVRNG